MPWVQFDVRNELFSAGSAGHLLEPWSSVPTRDDEQGQRISYVVDAIDNIDSKVLLLQHCHQNHLPVISTMGAGLKSDPTRIMVGDISTTNEDPLSRAVRIRLRKLNINNGFPCVFSTETAGIGKATLTPLTDEQLAEGSVDELSILPNFRIRILPVLGTMPSIFGNTAANHVILEIAGYPHDYLPFKSKQKMWDGILSKLQGSEERLARNFHGNSSQGVKLGIAINDVGFLVEEIYRGRSVLSQQTSKLNLIRWARPKDGYLFKPTVDRCERVSNLALEDVVLLSSEEAAIHEKRILEDGELTTDVYSSASCRLVQTKQGEAKKWNSYR